MKRKKQLSDLLANAKKLATKNPQKFTPETLLNDVKGLLSTGLLEGVQVTYMKGKKELLSGIIKDLGYECGCSLCNYSKVLSASEFEKHARVETSNQNNHVFLKSGITMYDLVKELSKSNYTLGSLGEVIEEKIGCLPNMKHFKEWKDSFQMPRQELQKTSTDSSEDLRDKPELLDFLQTTRHTLQRGNRNREEVLKNPQEIHNQLEYNTCSQAPAPRSSYPDSSTNDKFSSQAPVPRSSYPDSSTNDKFSSQAPAPRSSYPDSSTNDKFSSQAPAPRSSNPDSSTNDKFTSQAPAPRSSYPDSSTNDKFSSPEPTTEVRIGSTPATNIMFTSTKPATEGNAIPTSPIRQNGTMLEDETKFEKRSQLPPDSTYLRKSGVSYVQQKTGGQESKKRDNDLHQLLFKKNGLPDGSELSYCIKEKIILRGYKLQTGILCHCCNKKISPSQFESHAGNSARRQPYHNIYTSNGISLHELSISLSNGETLETMYTDDQCTICENHGDLVPCDGCPRAFHADCLKLLNRPDGGRYCPYCEDKSGYKAAAVVTSSSVVKPVSRRLRCVNDELGGCVLCKDMDFELGEYTTRTVMICHQCEKEYHVGCLKDKGICDLKEYPGMWICCIECDTVYASLRKLVLYGPKIVPESLLNTSLKNAERDVTNKLGVEVKWQLLSGKHQSSELLSKVAEIFQDAFSPVVERGQNLIPAMVYGQQVAGQYYEGMYCAILTVKSVIVSAGILRVFGRHLAELPLVATPRESKRKGYFQTLLLLIERVLTCLRVEVLILPVADEEKSMWINKFGFTEMTSERLSKYTREHPLLMFERTTMLEKPAAVFSQDARRDEMFNFSISSMEF